MIDNVITVASGCVHVRDHPWPYRAFACLFWLGHVPVLTRLLGYLPGRLLGVSADLLAALYWQWRGRGIHPDFYFADPEVAERKPGWPEHVPARLIAIADDPVYPPEAVDRLAKLYGPTAEVLHVESRAFGLRRLGISTRSRAKAQPFGQFWSRPLRRCALVHCLSERARPLAFLGVFRTRKKTIYVHLGGCSQYLNCRSVGLGERLYNDPSGARYGCFLPDLTGLARRSPVPTSRGYRYVGGFGFAMVRRGDCHLFVTNAR